jgi:Flp pilus assembly pilin Flp
MLVCLVRFSARRGQRGNECGATAVEYGLLLAFVAAVIVAAVITLGQDTLGLFSSVPTF